MWIILPINRFPIDQRNSEAWLDAIGNNYVTVARPSICSEHFKPGLIDVRPGQRPIIRKNALPTIFPSNKTVSTSTTHQNTTNDYTQFHYDFIFSLFVERKILMLCIVRRTIHQFSTRRILMRNSHRSTIRNHHCQWLFPALNR